MTRQAGKLRIIGGTHGGRRIDIPPGENARPTGDRVREALFSILTSGVGNTPGLADSRVLDACAGSGALGIEALSRGASQAIFFDTDPRAVSQIRQNLEALDLADRASVQRADASKPPAGEPCNVVFLDPPYDSDTAQAAPAALAAAGWITTGGILVIETRRETAISLGDGFETVDERNYGDTTLHFIARTG